MNSNYPSYPNTQFPIITIASSTGGTEALKKLLPSILRTDCAFLMIQHMPPGFTKTFANTLQDKLDFDIKEGEIGDHILPGKAFLAPGDYHMTVKKSFNQYTLDLNKNDLCHGVRPAADLTMFSVANLLGSRTIGIVLTGMGKDGAQGLLKIKKMGGYNLAQDEQSSVVFGMAKEAINIGAIDKVLPLDKIGPYVHRLLEKRSAA